MFRSVFLVCRFCPKKGFFLLLRFFLAPCVLYFVMLFYVVVCIRVVGSVHNELVVDREVGGVSRAAAAWGGSNPFQKYTPAEMRQMQQDNTTIHPVLRAVSCGELTTLDIIKSWSRESHLLMQHYWDASCYCVFGSRRYKQLVLPAMLHGSPSRCCRWPQRRGDESQTERAALLARMYRSGQRVV